MTKINYGTTDSECSICFEPLAKGDETNQIVIHPDNTIPHIFHRDCLTQWAQEHDTCPLCRTKLSEREIQQLDISRPPLDNYKAANNIFSKIGLLLLLSTLATACLAMVGGTGVPLFLAGLLLTAAILSMIIAAFCKNRSARAS